MEVSPIDDFFSDTLGCSPSSLLDAVGAPAEVMASQSLTADSLNTSLNMTPEDVKRSMRKALSSKRSYRGWTLNLSLPEATERKPKPAKARSTSRGGASTVSWSCVDSEAAGQSAFGHGPPPGKKPKDKQAEDPTVDYGPPPGKRPKEASQARSSGSGDAGTRAGGLDGAPSRPPKLPPPSRSSSSARQVSSPRKGDSSGSRRPARGRPHAKRHAPERASTPPTLPVKTGGTEHFSIASDDERSKREAFLRAETLIEVRAMELETQKS